MQMPTWRPSKGGLLFVRRCHKNGGQWTTRRAYGNLQYCGLVSWSIYPHYRKSNGLLQLRGTAFSTSAVAYRQAARSADTLQSMALKKARAKRTPTSGSGQGTKEVGGLEKFLRPRLELRMAGSPETKQESKTNATSEAWTKHNELTRMFYKKVQAENQIYWVESSKLKGVPRSVMAKWHFTPRSGRVGLARTHGTISHVTTHIEDQELRRKLTDWDANSCEHLAPFFREILMMRAQLAKSYGCDNYMDLRAQFKMIDRTSAEKFLNSLRQHLSPRITSHMDELFKMKLRDMGYHLSFETLRDNLRHYGHTILDFQDEHPKYQLHRGEVARYSYLKREENRGLDARKYMDYFPLQSTARKLLDILGPVFGLQFEELLPNETRHIKVRSDYLGSNQSNSKIFDNEEKLLIFHVKDTRFPKSGSPMGYLVLDLLIRPGKVLAGSMRKFKDYSQDGSKTGNQTPGLAILASIPRPTTKMPNLLSYGDLKILAHEVGHAIHHFVRGDLVGVPPDSVEIPSILLEKWVGDPRILQKLSSHYAYEEKSYLSFWKSENPTESSLPPQKAPLDTLDQVILDNHPANNILYYQILIWKAKFDLNVHSYSAEQLRDANIGHDCGNILGEWAGIFDRGSKREGSNTMDRNNNTYLNWTELEGYATSYYTYLYAEVYTVDIFNEFFARDPLNRQQGMRFRKIFLEHRDYFPSRAYALYFKRNPLERLCLIIKLKLLGRSENTMDALEKFMGRKLSMKPFIKALNAPVRKKGEQRLRFRLRIIWASMQSMARRIRRPSSKHSD